MERVSLLSEGVRRCERIVAVGICHGRPQQGGAVFDGDGRPRLCHTCQGGGVVTVVGHGV